MALEDEVHPLADTDGKPIPFNIARPHGALIIPFTDAVSSPVSLSDITVPHVFLSDYDCLVGFNVSPDRTSVVYQADVLFVPAGKEVSVMPLHATLRVQALIAAQTGNLLVQAFERYKTLGRDILKEALGP